MVRAYETKEMPVLDISRYEAHGIIGIYAILSVYDFQNETATISIPGTRSFELYIYIYIATFDRILNSFFIFTTRSSPVNSISSVLQRSYLYIIVHLVSSLQ